MRPVEMQTQVRTEVKTYAAYALLVASYFLACLLRSSSSVVLPKIAYSIGLASGAVGLISGMYFYGYTLAQPYSGSLCDKRGPLAACGLGMFLFACGTILFAIWHSVWGLAAGRFLMGLGAGPTFCGILVFQARAFSPSIYPVLTGISISLGHMGGVFAISPIGWALDNLGHTFVHLAIAAISAAIGAALFLLRNVVELRPVKGQNEKESGLRAIVRGFKMIACSGKLVRLTSIWSVTMVLQLTLIGLWGVSWIVDAGALAERDARFCMSVAGVFVLVGAFISGFNGRAWTSAPGIMKKFGILLCCVLLAFILSIDKTPGKGLLLFLSALFGFLVGSLNVLCNAALHRIVGSDVIGTAMGTINTILFLAVLIVQWASGELLEKLTEVFAVEGISTAYAWTFSVILVFSAIAVFYFNTIKDYDRES